MWSAGYLLKISHLLNFSISCFLGELLLGKPLFPGAKESQQLEFIYDKCGSPEEESWPGVRSLPFFSELGPKKAYQRNLLSYMRLHKQKFEFLIFLRFFKKKLINLLSLDDLALNLLDNLLTLNPEKRLSAKEAMAHGFFKNEPMPCEPSQ